MKKGDIVLIPFPFTNLLGSKNRPAVILIVGQQDITIAFITSQLKWKEDFDCILKPDQLNNLKTDSLIKLNKLATVEMDLVVGKIGEINPSILSEINKNLIQLFDLH